MLQQWARRTWQRSWGHRVQETLHLWTALTGFWRGAAANSLASKVKTWLNNMRQWKVFLHMNWDSLELNKIRFDFPVVSKQFYSFNSGMYLWLNNMDLTTGASPHPPKNSFSSFLPDLFYFEFIPLTCSIPSYQKCKPWLVSKHTWIHVNKISDDNSKNPREEN